MKGDFSKLTFNASKHFRRVLMQQGRVQLDADWNEQTAILLHYMETLAKDLLGPAAGPKGCRGFEITPIAGKSDNFIIGNGRYYVDGILVELEDGGSLPYEKNSTPTNSVNLPVLSIGDIPFKKDEYLELSSGNVTGTYTITDIKTDTSDLTLSPVGVSASVPEKGTLKRIATYNTQDDYLLQSTDSLKKDIYLVYLDIWERHITYVEDDSIREVALGGPDTATRTKLVWQVKATNNKPDGSKALKDINPVPDWTKYINAENHWQDWKSQWQSANRGLLKAQAKQDSKKDTEPCNISAEASYRSTENQLYRVEIHKGSGKAGAMAATFKWSRDNGSVVTGAKFSKTGSGTELTVDNPHGFTAGLWVELTNDNQELRGERGTLVKIKTIDGDILSLEVTDTPKPTDSLPANEVWPTKARLWESDEITIQESDKVWTLLADGVQIQFQPLNGVANQYRTGDYWLIPARVATGDVEWPGTEGKPEALPPFGIEHHYAPLAVITVAADGITVAELRQQIKPPVAPCQKLYSDSIVEKIPVPAKAIPASRAAVANKKI